MSTQLTTMWSLEPLIDNRNSWPYTDMESGNVLAYSLTDQSESWETWTAQVADTSTYAVTETDTENAAKFSSFFVSFYIAPTFTLAEDDGICFISSKWGTVCLLKDDWVSIDTYRVSTSAWATATAEATYADLVTNIKGVTDSKQPSTD